MAKMTQPSFGGGKGLTQPKFGSPSSGASDNGKMAKSAAKDKSGFHGSHVDPGIRTVFVDAVAKK